jgi:predicted membrane channel-forming protein YqfA (hemolysin III family)
MKEPLGKYRKYEIATYIIMAVGIILFMLTPLLIRWFGFDSDVLGLLVFLIGLVMFVVGIIVRLIMRKVGSHRRIN